MFAKLFPNADQNSYGDRIGQPKRALIELTDVVKVYQSAAGSFQALKDVNLIVDEGEFVAIVGKSGSGKSTLMNMITGIDRPTSGQVWVANEPIHTYSENRMAAWRGKHVGVVFQFFQLLPMLSVIENVMLPMDFCAYKGMQARCERATMLLEQVGVVEHAFKLPSELSGGQQQRVAIARALANDPCLLIGDEPTGNLDSRTAQAVFDLFGQLVAEGKTVMMVTHDVDLAAMAPRRITLADGQVVAEGQQSPAVEAVYA